MTKTHTARPVWIVLALLSAALLLSVMVGSVFIPLESLLAAIKNGLAGNPDADTFTTILFSLRLPRTPLPYLIGVMALFSLPATSVFTTNIVAIRLSGSTSI